MIIRLSLCASYEAKLFPSPLFDRGLQHRPSTVIGFDLAQMKMTGFAAIRFHLAHPFLLNCGEKFNRSKRGAAIVLWCSREGERVSGFGFRVSGLK